MDNTKVNPTTAIATIAVESGPKSLLEELKAIDPTDLSIQSALNEERRENRGRFDRRVKANRIIATAITEGINQDGVLDALQHLGVNMRWQESKIKELYANGPKIRRKDSPFDALKDALELSRYASPISIQQLDEIKENPGHKTPYQESALEVAQEFLRHIDESHAVASRFFENIDLTKAPDFVGRKDESGRDFTNNGDEIRWLAEGSSICKRNVSDDILKLGNISTQATTIRQLADEVVESFRKGYNPP